ncbi:sigma-70 family RNA polymerase sigma factor [Actinokineospora sp. PR83]|uniref:sigma-70 family RNA polymerase sigma factor n=1 Tax=Actinokineospora sp. PR83 TaxID=2884908 RepID=UPI001F44B212|nr:sigma-70 family RNA polymerase sigma factor [Actinokineospora sp. PR83]MCG8916477.1 sigma-70 family RNA polymerase sigma factor [Actinokineospora sp. PR83]
MTTTASTLLDEIVRAHGPALLAYTTRLTGGDRHRAEDVVQETWLRAWRNLTRLTDDQGSVRGWLKRVAHNIAVDQHRARAARPAEVEMPATDPTATPERADEVVDRLFVADVLRALPTAHRATLAEVYLADRSTAAAAVALQVPVGTVKSRVHNALRTLRTTVPALEAA